MRAAVLEGLAALVDNMHAQPVLCKALPQLGPLVHDPSPRVRLALAELLACIRSSRGLHWWDVVPLDVLSAALGEETSEEVAARFLTTLLPTIFPGPEEGASLVAGMLRRTPDTGRAFCALLAKPLLEGGSGSVAGGVLPLEQVLALAGSLVGHLAAGGPQADPACSPPRKQRGGRGGSRAAPSAAAAAGAKRRKAPAAGGSADAEAGEGEEVVAPEGESADSWLAILAGAAELFSGIGKALQAELCEWLVLVHACVCGGGACV